MFVVWDLELSQPRCMDHRAAQTVGVIRLGGTQAKVDALRQTVHQLLQRIEVNERHIANLTQQLANQNPNFIRNQVFPNPLF